MSAESLVDTQAEFAGAPLAGGHVQPTRQRKQKRPAAKFTKNSATQKQLIDSLKAGDERALETLFTMHSGKLYNVALRILGGAASDAEEVIQDVFLTAFRKARMFQGNSQFSTWLYRLTVNAALGRVRSAKRHKEVAYDEFLPKFRQDGHHAVQPVVDWSETLDEKFANQELQRLLNQALDQLKPIDRSVVVLSDLEGMADKEIAATLDLSVSAVKTRLHRARLFLRGKLALCLGHSAA